MADDLINAGEQMITFFADLWEVGGPRGVSPLALLVVIDIILPPAPAAHFVSQTLHLYTCSLSDAILPING